jgi:hypothetical protein
MSRAPLNLRKLPSYYSALYSEIQDNFKGDFYLLKLIINNVMQKITVNKMKTTVFKGKELIRCKILAHLLL